MNNVKPQQVPSLPYSITMSVEDWINVEDNPIQRDTKKRAKKAYHLHVFQPVHAEVRMAKLPNGRCIKLDAHTRSFLWDGGLKSRGILPARPEILLVAVYPCRDLQHAKRLYEKFDSKAALKSPQDEIQGAHRELGLKFESPLLKNAFYALSVRTLYLALYGNKDQGPGFLRRCVKEFTPELKSLDACGPRSNLFPVSFVMAALSTIRVYKEPAVDFWTRYARKEGWRIDSESDPVQALHEYLSAARIEKRLSKQFYAEVMSRAVNAVEKDMRGGTYEKRINKKTTAELAVFLTKAKHT